MRVLPHLHLTCNEVQSGNTATPCHPPWLDAIAQGTGPGLRLDI